MAIQRVDIEEAVNLAAEMPEKTAAMNQQLTEMLTEMQASYPYYNPKAQSIPGRDSVCTVESHELDGGKVKCVFKENGAKVTQADLIYTLNGGTTASIDLPARTTHYYINLVDENQFLVSYPDVDLSLIHI